MKKIRTKIIETLNKNKSSGINLLILSVIALFIKQYCTYLTYKNLSYGFKYYLNSFSTDLIVILIIAALTTINHYIKNRIIKILNNIISFAIFIVFCIDIFTIYFLQNRVAIPEALQYVNNGSNGFANKVITIIIAIILIRSLSLYLTSKIKKNSKITKNILLSIFLILVGISVIFSTPKSITNIITLNINYIKEKKQLKSGHNIIESNTGENKDKTEENEEKIKEYEDYIKHIKGDGKELNIILVFAESISAIDSANMGGNNNMPGFDEIQKNGIKFENFIENGATSDTAHISTLLGVMPLANIGLEDTVYSGYKLIMEPLPEFLNKQGYKTTFISAASLEFLEQRTFLSGAGFQKIIGEEEFANKKKYVFDAAPDKDLYDRVLEEIKVQTGKYFIGLQTISFHKPYNTPNGKTAKAALQYSDQELYNFYNSLKEIGFFDNGILIILGDHRKMEPADEGEYEILGRNRYTKPVATILGSGIKQGVTNKNIIQHTDFYNSIKRKVGKGIVEIDSNYNDIFQKSINRNRGMTSASHFENKYIITYIDKTGFTFNNISSLKEDDKKLYDYITSYYKFEFSNSTNEKMKNKNDSKQIIIGHQGARNYAPENSLLSFMKAKYEGADGIEFDISYTKDKENIVAHGEYFYASNCSGYKIQDYDYERINENCTLKNGEKYRTLKEMLELIDGLFDYYFLEIKVVDESLGAEQTEKAIQTVKNLNMQDKIIFISYSDSARKVLESHDDIIFGWDTYNINDIDFIGENKSKYFLAPSGSLTQEAIDKAKILGKEVGTYTINNTGDFQKMKDLGVKIILTDEIGLIRNYNDIE